MAKYGFKRLTCCVCGDCAGKWQQHWNRDTGYGVCIKCIEWTRQRAQERRGGLTPENVEHEIRDLYGKEGVNWGPTPEPTETDLIAETKAICGISA